MSDLWYKKCYIQLEVEKVFEDEVRDCLGMFLEDQKWLSYCVSSALELGDFVLEKNEFDPNKVLFLMGRDIYEEEVIIEESTDIFKENTSTIDEVDNKDLLSDTIFIINDDCNFSLSREVTDDSIVERIIQLPSFSDIRIEKGKRLPEWFVEFFKQVEPHLRYSIKDWFFFQEHGSRGDIAPKRDPETILNILVKNGLSLGCQENSQSRKELCLFLISFYLENGLGARLEREKIKDSLSYPYAKDSISSIASTVKRKMKQLRMTHLG